MLNDKQKAILRLDGELRKTGIAIAGISIDNAEQVEVQYGGTVTTADRIILDNIIQNFDWSDSKTRQFDAETEFTQNTSLNTICLAVTTYILEQIHLIDPKYIVPTPEELAAGIRLAITSK